MNALWLAIAFVFILEGLMPFLLPKKWREMLSMVQSLRDGQIRFIGFVLLCCGILLLLVLTQ